MTEETAITVQDDSRITLGAMTLSHPGKVVEYATNIANELATIIKDQRLYKTISGRNYVYVEGWTTMGAMLGVTPHTESVEEIGEGVFEATVKLVRVNDGMVIGRGIAECGDPDETDRKGQPVWASRPRYARKSMAITRATGKAYRLAFSWIMKLSGYEATPWEEMAPVVVDGKLVGEDDAPEEAPQAAATPPTRAAAQKQVETPVQENGKQDGGPPNTDDITDLLDMRMSDLAGPDVYRVIQYSQSHSKTNHARHWEKRRDIHYPDIRGDIRKVDGTVAEFVDVMTTKATAEEQAA